MNHPSMSLAALCSSLLLFTACSEPPTVSQKSVDATPAVIQPETDDEQRIRQAEPAVPAPAMTDQALPAPAGMPVGSMEEAKRKMIASEVSSLYLAAEPQRVDTTRLITESYQPHPENRFIATANDSLSTFSIDVDTASYANIRRFLNGGSLPPSGAVRIEEMVNYFTYDYPKPQSGPFALSAEVGPAPWNTAHQLVKIGVQAKDIADTDIPPSNLVFLVDVSGSMHDDNKLPLLQKSLLLLTDELGKRDRVAIVAYAGSDRVVLPPTRGDDKKAIRSAISSLTSGGSTHASRGIATAYELAERGLLPSGNNRVILASDGDFNVGITDRGELEHLIASKRETGIYLTVLGFGMGNYHDDTMELLADKGNGNYAYIDSLLEAKKVLVKERAATLFSLANDVKIQVEFNPAMVGAYRLIGYENRMLADEDFRDDTKDAGEIGLGHRVTALYELIPTGSEDIPSVAPLKYRQPSPKATHESELMTVKLRYKPKGSDRSSLLQTSVEHKGTSLTETSDDFRFAAAVAAFGMSLRHSDQVSDFTTGDILALARSGRGEDREGYRAEFCQLVEKAELMVHR